MSGGPATAPDKPPRIALLLADVDGTLVTKDKILTERAVKAVDALRERGIRFAITSGRPPRGMAMLLDALKLDTPIAGFNGGAFVNPDLSPIEARTLPRGVTEEAVKIIGEAGLDPWLYAGEDWLVHDLKAPHVDREAWTVKFQPTVAADFSDRLDEAVKIVGVSDDRDKVAACEAALRKALGAKASAARSQPYYVDVTHPDANKGFVVGFLAKRLGIPAGEIATIGDMPNDVLMFEKSGFSIAMGQSADDVKGSASAVTESYEDEGFAKALERFLLG